MFNLLIFQFNCLIRQAIYGNNIYSKIYKFFHNKSLKPIVLKICFLLKHGFSTAESVETIIFPRDEKRVKTFNYEKTI